MAWETLNGQQHIETVPRKLPRLLWRQAGREHP
jgi:hypothetical protein